MGYREEVLIEQLLELARVGAQEKAGQAGSIASMPEGLEKVAPQGSGAALSDSTPTTSVAQVEASLLAGETSPRRWPRCGKARRAG